MHDGLTGIEEAEWDRAGSRGAFDGPPRSAVLPLQLGSAKAIGIEQHDVAEIRYGDVDRLTREVGILDDRSDALSRTGVVGSHASASRCDQCECTEKAQVQPSQRPPHDSPLRFGVSFLRSKLSNKV